MSAADNHFGLPKYTQDEWDCAQDEIERLKADYQKRLGAEENLYRALADAGAEIDRLKAENETCKAAIASYEVGRVWREGLISELANALEYHERMSGNEDFGLIQRAREAITR